MRGRCAELPVAEQLERSLPFPCGAREKAWKYVERILDLALSTRLTARAFTPQDHSMLLPQ